jgi:hypothetical protein
MNCGIFYRKIGTNCSNSLRIEDTAIWGEGYPCTATLFAWEECAQGYSRIEFSYEAMTFPSDDADDYDMDFWCQSKTQTLHCHHVRSLMHPETNRFEGTQPPSLVVDAT